MATRDIDVRPSPAKDARNGRVGPFAVAHVAGYTCPGGGGRCMAGGSTKPPNMLRALSSEPKLEVTQTLVLRPFLGRGNGVGRSDLVELSRGAAGTGLVFNRERWGDGAARTRRNAMGCPHPRRM